VRGEIKMTAERILRCPEITFLAGEADWGQNQNRGRRVNRFPRCIETREMKEGVSSSIVAPGGREIVHEMRGGVEKGATVCLNASDVETIGVGAGV